MSRYIKEIQLNQPADFVTYIMNDFFTKNGFYKTEFKGEAVYRIGDGFFTLPRFIKYSYENGLFHLEAWSRTPILPGVYLKEKDLTGVSGALLKQGLKKDIENLIQVLGQELPESATNNVAAATKEPIMVQGIDNSKKATAGLICGICGLVFSFLVPLIGIILAGFAIGNGTKAKHSSNSGMATAALVLGIIAMTLSVVIWIYNFASSAVALSLLYK